MVPYYTAHKLLNWHLQVVIWAAFMHWKTPPPHMEAVLQKALLLRPRPGLQCCSLLAAVQVWLRVNEICVWLCVCVCVAVWIDTSDARLVVHYVSPHPVFGAAVAPGRSGRCSIEISGSLIDCRTVLSSVQTRSTPLHYCLLCSCPWDLKELQ